MKGFTEVMKEKGIHIKTDILYFDEDQYDEYIRAELNIKDTDETIYKIERLRYIEDEPFGIELSYIPKHMCNDLGKELDNNKSLYSILSDKYGYKMKKAEQIIEPIMLSKEEAKLLKQKGGTLALKLKRTSYIEDGTPIEYTISIFRSDKYQYEIVLNG
jgi:GntR family transcriptional regulator